MEKLIIIIYISLSLTIIIHEATHYLLLKIYKFKAFYLKIGIGKGIKFKNIEVTPFIIGWYNTINYSEFYKISLISKMVIIILPSILNIMLFIIFENSYPLFSYFNLLYGVGNLLPIPFLNNDGWHLLKVITNRMK